MYHYQICGLDNIYLVNGFREIEYAGEIAVSVHDLEGLHRTITYSLVNKSEHLSGREFRFLRLEMDLSQAALGKLFGVSDQAIAKWEKEQSSIPTPAELLIRAYAEDKIVNGSGKVAELIEKLVELDHKDMEKLEFQETDQGWVSAIAAPREEKSIKHAFVS